MSKAPECEFCAVSAKEVNYLYLFYAKVFAEYQFACPDCWEFVVLADYEAADQ